jgi:hypothetical protein
MIDQLKQNYNARTPFRWRALGDSILMGGLAINAAVVGSPLEESTQKWVIFFLSILCAIIKIFTNFIKETEEDKAQYRKDPAP